MRSRGSETPARSSESAPGTTQLDELDATIVLGHEGRAAHLAATRDLAEVSTQIVGAVRVMHGRSRHRFAGDAQLFGSWLNVSRWGEFAK